MLQHEQVGDQPAKRTYEAPKIEVMDQKEVLAAFQITSAAMSWWG